MRHHEIYDEYFEIDPHNPRVCELTGAIRPEIHHIDARGMGGRDMDFIENLMALNSRAHEFYGDKTKHKNFLKKAHAYFMETREPYIIKHRFNPHMQAYLTQVHKIR